MSHAQVPKARPDRIARTTVAILVLLLVAAACGGDEASDTTAATAAATAAPGTTPSEDSGSGVSSSDDGDTATTYPLEIESCGFTSTLEAPPERIVVYYDLVEPLLAWGLGDKIVGWHTYNATSLYPGMNELMAELEITAEPWPRETLTALEPDLVITASWWSFNSEAGFLTREELADAGVATYIPASLCAQDRADATAEEIVTLSNRGFDDMIAELADLGVIVDKQAEAAALIDELTTKMDQVEAAIGDVEPVRTAVLAVDGTGETIWGVYVGGSNEDYITRAGGVNPFRDPTQQFKALSIEELTNVPLDVLLIDSDGTEERNQTALAMFPTWPAFENGRVGNVPGLVTSSLGTPWTVERLAVLLDTARSGDSAMEVATYPVTVTSCGAEMVVGARPERVIAYTDAQTELFVALGLADVVVGEIWDFEALVRPENEEAVRAVEALATDAWPSREQVAALEPDFIFAPYWFFDEVAPVEDFESTGAVAYLPADGCPEPAADVFAGQIADIENLGLIFGVQDRAAELVEELRGGLDELTAALADVESTPVLWVDYVFDDDRGVQLISSEFYAETVGLGGGELLLAGRDDTPSQEQVVAARPDVVFITDIYGRTGYETTPEERSEQVFALLTNAPATAARAWAPMPITPRTAIGYVDQIRAVAEVLHPDAL